MLRGVRDKVFNASHDLIEESVAINQIAEA